MVLTVEEAKKYLRVDGDEEDDLITSLVEAAEIYIKNATSKNVDLKSELAT
ncbi:head-tail connector protein, partial [Bacillus cereus]|uniref:head-tail connector protein n=1 Tax=Bacillus cereus TaxID=1396 RepID=UPI000BFB07E6